MKGTEGTLLITEQISELLDQLNQNIYTQPLQVFHQGTIGEHIRHILEFYICLIEEAACTKVDYSTRRRNLALSQEIHHARTAIQYIEDTIPDLYEHQNLQIVNEYGEESPCLKDECFSSIGRELQYAFDHAIHHLAIVRIGIESNWPTVQVNPQLGIAPSTLQYHNKKKKNSKAPVYQLY